MFSTIEAYILFSYTWPYLLAIYIGISLVGFTLSLLEKKKRSIRTHLIRKQLIVDEMSFLKGSNHIKNDTYEKIYPYQTLREHTKQYQKTFKKYQMPI